MNTKSKRVIKRVAVIIASLLFVLTAVNMVVAWQAERYIRTQLERVVNDVTGGLYDLSFGNINVDILEGYLSAKNIELTVNPERYNRLKELDSLPEMTGIVKIRSLKLTGVNLKYTRHHGRKLGFEHLAIEQPELIVLTYPGKDKTKEGDDESNSKPRIAPHTPYDFIAPYFDEFSISHVTLSGGNIFLLQEKDGKIKPVANVMGFGIEAGMFDINSSRTLNNSIFFTDDMLLSFRNLTVHSQGHFYDYFAGNTTIDMRRGEININELGFSSPISKWDFAKLHPKHADWFDLKIGELSLKGLDIKKLIDHHTLTADTLLAGPVLLQNYKNGQIPIEHNYMPMIYTARQNLPLPFFIKYVHVSDMNVVYEELAMNATDPGQVTLTDLDGVFLDYTNIATTPKQTTTLYASGKLMGEGKLETMITLPVDPTYDRVEMKARMGVMNMLALNSIFEPMAPGKIAGGFIQGLDMYIDASGEQSHIDLTLLYNDLSVEILQSLNNGRKANIGLLSFFANGLIEKNNPQPNQDVRVVHADHIRDPLHSSFNYLWKTILSALVKVLGYTDERQERVNWAKSTFQSPPA